MIQSNIYTLHYNRLMSLPILGSTAYKLQAIFLQYGSLHELSISRKKSSLKKRLLSSIPKNASIICKTHLLKEDLFKLNQRITLDLELNVSNLSVANLYDLMWSLVYASAVTDRTKKALGSFLPINYPTHKQIIIPYHEKFDVNTDFVLQTVRALVKQGHEVYLLAFAVPKFIFSTKSKNICTTNLGRLSSPNLHIIPARSLIPNILANNSWFRKLNYFFSKLIAAMFIKTLSKPILWCFDHEDLELVKMTKHHATSLYDCVDYFTSSDHKARTRIANRENQLIKQVDYCFVNSNALFSQKKHLRPQIHIVPQGFDLDSFTQNGLTYSDRGKIKALTTKIASIPKPIVGFVGNLTYRLDFKLLNYLATTMPNVSFVFVGNYLPMPADDALINTETEITSLSNNKNVYLIKNVSRKFIKYTLNKFAIGIIPYDTTFDFNKYCFPMKIFEYFYCRIPVLSSDIIELKRFIPFVTIAKDHRDWQKKIINKLQDSKSHEILYNLRSLAVQNSWNNKVSEIVSILQ